MDAFVSMRKFINENKDIFKRLTTVEYKMLEYDENFDKFALTVNFLSYLKKDFYFELLYYYNDSFNYLDDYVRSLDIDKRLKEFLLHQISEDLNKEYLGDHIDLVSSNKRFIK